MNSFDVKGPIGLPVPVKGNETNRMIFSPVLHYDKKHRAGFRMLMGFTQPYVPEPTPDPPSGGTPVSSNVIPFPSRKVKRNYGVAANNVVPLRKVA